MHENGLLKRLKRGESRRSQLGLESGDEKHLRGVHPLDKHQGRGDVGSCCSKDVVWDLFPKAGDHIVRQRYGLDVWNQPLWLAGLCMLDEAKLRTGNVADDFKKDIHYRVWQLRSGIKYPC